MNLCVPHYLRICNFATANPLLLKTVCSFYVFLWLAHYQTFGWSGCLSRLAHTDNFFKIRNEPNIIYNIIDTKVQHTPAFGSSKEPSELLACSATGALGRCLAFLKEQSYYWKTTAGLQLEIFWELQSVIPVAGPPIGSSHMKWLRWLAWLC